MSAVTITKENFEQEVLKSDIPVVVDFWATWCGPCKMLAPVIEELAAEGNVKVGKINVDEEGELAMKFEVMSIPALFVLKGGEIVGSALGARPKAQILDMLEG